MRLESKEKFVSWGKKYVIQSLSRFGTVYNPRPDR